MAIQTIACMSRPALAVRRSTVSARNTFVGSPINRRTVVNKAAKKIAARASANSELDVEEIVKDLSEKWDKVENKTGVIVYASGAFVAIWLSSTVVGALNGVPLLPKLFELVGLGYSAWFTYRYLLFKSSREELLTDIEQLKKKISGDL